MTNSSAIGAGLGARIREARRGRHLSQQELADAVGVSSQAVGQWERGDNNPSHSRLERLVEVLGRSLVWFLTGEEASSAVAENAVRAAVEAYEPPRIEPPTLDAGVMALAAVMTFDRLKALGSLTTLDGQTFWRECVANYDIARATLVEFGSGSRSEGD